MLEDGVEPNVITFNAVISACAKKGQGNRAESWLGKMKLADVCPNSFSYNSAAKPFVAQGDYHKVEQLMAELHSDGLELDEYCHCSLIHAYGNAKPKQRHLAETAFREYAGACPSGAVSASVLSALVRVLGRAAANALSEECDAKAHVPQPEAVRS